MMRAGMMREMGWQVDEEMNGEADGMNLEVDSKDEVIFLKKFFLNPVLVFKVLRLSLKPG